MIRGAATNGGLGGWGVGGEQVYIKTFFWYRKYERGIKEYNVSSLCS